MRNPLIFVILFLLVLAALIAIQPQNVSAPVKDGKGPLAVQIDSRLVAPEYHSPIAWWRTHHMDAVNGGDFVEADCLTCHDPAKSCNNCHSYVGVKQIIQVSP
jgi:hypothetical protein